MASSISKQCLEARSDIHTTSRIRTRHSSMHTAYRHWPNHRDPLSKSFRAVKRFVALHGHYIDRFVTGLACAQSGLINIVQVLYLLLKANSSVLKDQSSWIVFTKISSLCWAGPFKGRSEFPFTLAGLQIFSCSQPEI
jgi:hypothetical protein